MSRDKLAEALRLVFPNGISPEDFPLLSELVVRVLAGEMMPANSPEKLESSDGGGLAKLAKLSPNFHIAPNPGGAPVEREGRYLSPGQQRVLDTLAGGPMTMPQIAEAAGVVRSSVRDAIKALRSKGHNIVCRPGAGRDQYDRAVDVYELG